MEPGYQWRNGLAESAVKLVKSTLGLVLASQSTLNYAELDTLFARVADIVNNRPKAVRSFTQEDAHAITPNDLLLGRTRNRVPGPRYENNDSLTRRQEVINEMEQTWWQMWIVQALPQLVPYRRWKTDHRSLQVGDIVLVLYDKNLRAGEYQLGQIIRTHPDAHGRVRTVVVGMRRKVKESSAEFIPSKLEEHTLGIQRVAVICPVEEQGLVDGACTDEISDEADGLNAIGEEVRDGESVLGNRTALGDAGILWKQYGQTGDEGAAQVSTDVNDAGGNLQKVSVDENDG